MSSSVSDLGDVEKAKIPVEPQDNGSNDARDEEKADHDLDLETVPTTESKHRKRSISLSLRKTKSKKKQELRVEHYPETNLDAGLVGWDSQDDPLHPRNFPDSKKWLFLGFVSGITFLSPLTSSIAAPGVPLMDETFHNTSQILASFSISIFVLGFAVGPLVLSPLSEIYGRIPVLNYANILLTVWQIGCAKAPSIGALIGFRFLAGIGGSACLTVGGGVIADLFAIEQRGKANAAFSLGPLFGPVVGPIIGGFIAQRAGWRWVYWVLLIACGILTVGNAVFNRETNAVVLIRRKTDRLRKELGRDDLQSAYDAGKDPKTLQKRTVLLRGVVRPMHMLFFSPIFSLLAVYMSFVFGLLYLIFTTITDVFINNYGFSIELCGLAYLGPGIGFGLGLIAFAKTSDKTIIRLTKANNGVYQPEMRLASCLFFAFFIPISFFWYGWTSDKHVHWIVPIIGLIPFGFGLMGIFAPIQTYFIDAGGPYAASAVAGLTACRCLVAAFLPLGAPKMYESLGLGWGNSLLGFIALGLIPAPALIYKYGEAIRRKYPIRLD